MPLTHLISVMKSIKKPAGAAMLEFALILPIFLAILFGVINYSILLFDQAVITNAAREGARWASINTTSTTQANCSSSVTGTTDPCGIANDYAKSVLITLGGGTLTSTSIGVGTKGSVVTVSVTYDYSGIGYGVVNLNRQLTAQAVMYHE